MWVDREVVNSTVQISYQAMGRSTAGFRISIKDNHASTGIKVELIESPRLRREKRFRLLSLDQRAGLPPVPIFSAGARA